MTGRQVEPVTVVTRAERERAVTDWLLSAAHDRLRARDDWKSIGITQLRCGGIFTIVAVPADIVHAAAGTVEPDAVDAFLREALDGGPVFIGASGQRYYTLVPASTARRWKSREAVCHVAGTFVRVPRPGRTRSQVGPGAAGWCVPMDSPGELCEPGAVATLITTGQGKARGWGM